MIEVGLLVERDGETLINMTTTFPILPQVGQSLMFWHGREKVGSIVEAVFFDQSADGSFVPVVTAKVPNFG